MGMDKGRVTHYRGLALRSFWRQAGSREWESVELVLSKMLQQKIGTSVLVQSTQTTILSHSRQTSNNNTTSSNNSSSILNQVYSICFAILTKGFSKQTIALI